MHFYTVFKASIQQRVSQSHSQISCDNQLPCITIASPAGLLHKCMNYPPFVLQLDTKNTLKLTPLADTIVLLFYRFIVTKGTHKNLLVYTKVTRPMQSRGREYFCGYKQVSY